MKPMYMGTYIVNHAFLLVPAQAFVAAHLQTYVEFPPRQKPGTFSLDQVLQKLQEAGEQRQGVTPRVGANVEFVQRPGVSDQRITPKSKQIQSRSASTEPGASHE